MGTRLRYDYQQGETLSYEISARTVLADPRSRTSDSTVLLRSATEVLDVSGDVYTLSMQCQLLPKGLSPLVELPPPTAPRVYTQDTRGKIQDTPSEGVPIQSALTFPVLEVEPGDFWEVTNAGPGGAPTVVEVDVDEIGQQGDDLVAQLSSRCDLDTGEEGSTGFIESEIHFSINRGRTLFSRTVTVMTWADGRKLTSTVESRLNPGPT